MSSLGAKRWARGLPVGAAQPDIPVNWADREAWHPFREGYTSAHKVVVRAAKCMNFFAPLIDQSSRPKMVAQDHYQRLKHLYAAEATEPVPGPVEIAYGHAKLMGTVRTESGAVVRRTPFRDLLADASSLAAASVEKNGRLSLDRFRLNIQRPDYQGAVQASAEVAVAEPPRYHVYAMLLDEAGEPVAESWALFEPSGEALPSDPAPEATDDTTDDTTPTPPPAPFMPIYATPMGILCLN